MDKTTTRDFRAQMKEYMDLARKEPIRVTRGSGASDVVIVDAEQFSKMQLELANLRGLTKGLMDVAEGRVRPYSAAEMKTLAAQSAARIKAKHGKKAVG
jgi:prevent-host-death family protein